MVFQLQHR